MAEKTSGLAWMARAVKGAAIVLGGVCTFVSFSSIVGIVTGNAWARALVALVLTVVVPMVVADRALPSQNTGKARPGIVVDVVALVLLGVALLFVGLGQPVTRPLLVREGDRLAEDGHEVPAHLVYFLGGVRPVDAPEPAPPPAPSASASGAPHE
ncbi:MAG: hypothetical protein ABSE49_30045 [Polyangiaceae bacterium]|jgi:hypothetical protein